MPSISRLAPSIALVVVALACGHHAAPDPSSARAMQEPPRVRGTPLAELAGAHIILLPAQQLRTADSLGWGASVGARAYLAALDEQIALALSQRGIGGTWALPADLARSARHNPSYAADPYALATASLLPIRHAGVELREPFTTQLRTMVALHDARFALVPLELRFEPAGAGMERAVLRVDLLDARLSQVRWTGEVSSDAAPALTSTLAATLAARFVDLIAAR